MRKLCFLLFLIFSISSLFGQQNLSVKMDHPVYHILNAMQVRGLCESLPTTKPYSQKRILKALNQALENESKLYQMEKDILVRYIDEFNGDIDYKWYQTGSYRYDNKNDKNRIEQANIRKIEAVEEIVSDKTELADKFVLYDDFKAEEKKDLLPISFEAGLKWSTYFNIDAVSRNIGTDNFVAIFVYGDISKYFSYHINVFGGLKLYQPNAYEPFSYRKDWLGTVFPLKGDDFGHDSSSLPTTLSGFTNFNPEFSFSFWEDRVGLRLARINRDWGYGNGGLMISKDAIPFTAIDFYINPVKWFSVSQLFGSLEPDFGGGASDLCNPNNFQNMYSATKVEFFIDKYVYLTAFASVLFPKRLEVSYLVPGLPASASQYTIGDFDNVQLGGSFGVKYPGWFDFYFSFFCDEAKFNTSAESFFHKDRNMFATQVGLNFEIPKIPFTSINLQYTKVSPYMYTHPMTKTPYFSNLMSTTYSNAGQNLGYALEPNSDELKISLETQPFWFFNAECKYSMIRHGVDVDGSTLFGAPLVYSGLLTNPLYNKNFLKDGVYEWFHTFGFLAEVDLRFLKPAIPIKIGLGYSFVYKYHTAWNGGGIAVGEPDAEESPARWEGGKMIYLNDAPYQNSQQHIFTFSVKVF